ncbi:MAG: substrate-binding domain-containing protein [Dehalococcoidia bacterium]|nr:substrate-binding domain-containing protein [Dehalococcoidia bacterium]
MDINFHPDEALYLQIADHFRRQIALGRLLPGHRLPAIRELAQRLGLDPGTAARAYQELERQGIITSRRGGGSFVAAGASEKHLPEQQRKRLGTLLEKPIMEALGLGFTTEDIETAFTMRLAEWRERRIQSSAKTKTKTPRLPDEVRFSGSHDIAVELLASHLSSLHPDIRLTTSFVGSLAGLMALEYRDADIAGAHLMDTESGEFNVPFIRKLMPSETVVLVNLMQRVQGLMLAPGNPKHIAGIHDLKRPGITFVNRQKGSGTRMLLDSRLLSLGIAPAKITGYKREESTHIGVATLIAGGQADAGLGAESAAGATGLDFIPLLKERYDLVALQETFGQPTMQRLLEVVRSQSFRKMLDSIGGYDLSDTGTTTVISPKQGKEREQ